MTHPAAPHAEAEQREEIAEAACWVLSLCDRIAAETDVPGTITRLFLSAATARVHALLQAEMEALGMSASLDAAGNLRGVYPAEHAGAPVLLLGSHLDTVPDAGRYDGVLGIAAALGLLRLLGGRRLPFAVETIAFSEEEGVRFRLPFIGSRGLVGTLGAAELARADLNGVTVAEALQQFAGVPGRLPGGSLLTPGTFAFLELHLEQGPVLEALDVPLGVVDTIVGQTRLELVFQGEANHAGTTPMALRHDALAAAAAFIVGVEAEARSTEGLVATVGVVHASPGAPNIVPGEARCSLDVRHADDAVRLQGVARLQKAAQSAAAERGCGLAVRTTSEVASVGMAPALVEALAEAAEETGRAVHRMHSGAGHDAMVVAGAVPAAMLFVRTPGGLSHHPAEAVHAGDVRDALRTLLRVLNRLRPPA